MACRILVSAPVPVPLLWTLDLGFGTWIWDLDLDLDLGLGFGTGLGLDNFCAYHIKNFLNFSKITLFIFLDLFLYELWSLKHQEFFFETL